MMTVGQLAQHILAIDPQKTQPRMAFYHYLKNFLPLDAEFRQEHIDSFFDYAVSIQYWQDNKKALGEAIQSDLQAIAARYPMGVDLGQVVYSHELQVITIECSRDFASLL